MRYRPLLNYQVAKPNGYALFSNRINYRAYRIKAEYELLANRYQDSTVQTMAEQDFRLLSDGYIWKEILWKDTSLNNNVDLKDILPKAIQFKPTGWTFVRSGWDIGSSSSPSNEFWANMVSGRNFWVHRYYVMSSFSIFYKGDLITNDQSNALW